MYSVSFEMITGVLTDSDCAKNVKQSCSESGFSIGWHQSARARTEKETSCNPAQAHYMNLCNNPALLIWLHFHLIVLEAG